MKLLKSIFVPFMVMLCAGLLTVIYWACHLILICVFWYVKMVMIFSVFILIGIWGYLILSWIRRWKKGKKLRGEW